MDAIAVSSLEKTLFMRKTRRAISHLITQGRDTDVPKGVSVWKTCSAISKGGLMEEKKMRRGKWSSDREVCGEGKKGAPQCKLTLRRRKPRTEGGASLDA